MRRGRTLLALLCTAIGLPLSAASALTLTPPGGTTANDPLDALAGCIVGAIEMDPATYTPVAAISALTQVIQNPVPGKSIRVGNNCPAAAKGKLIRWTANCWRTLPDGSQEHTPDASPFEVDCRNVLPQTPMLSDPWWQWGGQ